MCPGQVRERPCQSSSQRSLLIRHCAGGIAAAAAAVAVAVVVVVVVVVEVFAPVDGGAAVGS